MVRQPDTAGRRPAVAEPASLAARQSVWRAINFVTAGDQSVDPLGAWLDPTRRGQSFHVLYGVALMSLGVPSIGGLLTQLSAA